MRFSLPPHVRWPLFVVALLLFGVVSTLGMVFATRSDGGVEPLEDYYAESLRWNEHAAALRASEALGYRARLTLEPAGVEGLYSAVLEVTDRAGAPVEGLTGTIRVGRPHLPRALARLPLGEERAPGRYVQVLPLDEAGLWDLNVEATRGDAPFLTEIRVEVG